jgi:hypothetical protein
MRVPASQVMRAIDDVADAIVRAAMARIEAEAGSPSTALRAVPLPRFTGEDGE